MKALEPVLVEFFRSNTHFGPAGLHTAIGTGPQGVALDGLSSWGNFLIVSVTAAVPIGRVSARAVDYTVDFTVFSVRRMDAYTVAHDVLRALQDAVDNGDLPLVSMRPITLPVLVEQDLSTQDYAAVRFAAQMVAYYN